MTTTGRAVAFSGLTVLASAGGLFVFPQMLLRSVAWGSLAVVAGSLLMAVTLLPAMLALLGPRVDSLRVPLFPPRASAEASGFWCGLARGDEAGGDHDADVGHVVPELVEADAQHPGEIRQSRPPGVPAGRHRRTRRADP